MDVDFVPSGRPHDVVHSTDGKSGRRALEYPDYLTINPVISLSTIATS